MRTDPDDRLIGPGEGTLILPFGRERLLSLLPGGLRVAEIGVARGRFSRRIKRSARPSRLVLIDAWTHQAEADYPEDKNNVLEQAQYDRYRRVKAYFRLRHPLSRVDVVRAFSADAARTFPADSFDLAYIDANHEYAPALEDMELWTETLAPGGILMGHDMATHARAKLGVIQAVREFLRRRPDFHLYAITCEHFPSFVIAPRDANPSSPIAGLTDNLYARVHAKIMLPPDIALNFRQNRLFSPHTRRSSIMRFAPPEE